MLYLSACECGSVPYWTSVSLEGGGIIAGVTVLAPPHQSHDVHPFEARVNGVRLCGWSAGPSHGPLVLLLHGFPEYCFGWRHQLPALAAAGFHVLAPDLRGYNRSDKPRRVCDYRVETLAADVVGLIDHAGRRSAAVVGHDWGGIIAWYTAMLFPERLNRLAVLNAPHPAAYLRELRRGWSQRLRSWYVLFFQIPWLPEAALRWNDYAIPRRFFREGPARVSAAPAADVDRYVRALAEPGALTAMVNYYRATFRQAPSELSQFVRPISMPTLVLWGDRDRYLVRELADGLEPWVSNVRVEHLPKATHWVQHDEPAQVSEQLVAFLKPLSGQRSVAQTG